MGWKPRKQRASVYTKATVEQWIERMGKEKLTRNGLATALGIPATTVTNKLEAYYAGELND